MLQFYKFNIYIGQLTLKCLFWLEDDHLLLVSDSQSKQLSNYFLNLEAPHW